MRQIPRPSRVPARLGVFAAALVLVFGIAVGVGAAVHPGLPGASCAPLHGGAMQPEALGLSVSQDDTAIQPTIFDGKAGMSQALKFRILGRDGAPVRSGYQIEAQRRLHLVVVRRDLTGYQHLHPRMSADGTWRVPVTLSEAGAYRVFADFQLRCQKHVLAADLIAPGTFESKSLPAPRPSARVDGYDVRLQPPAVRADHEAQLVFSVFRGGRRVKAIQPYLGARGHLVALRQGDLAYLHVHPEEHEGAANAISFAAAFPSSGSYRLFLQFQVGGHVHTAGFTVEVAR